MPAPGVAEAGRPRWRGQPGRLEVHYLTATDEQTGSGLWVHCEVVAPVGGAPYAHGWVSVFPADAPARTERFGPDPVRPRDDDEWFRSNAATMDARGTTGTAGTARWQLSWDGEADPLWTFPRWAWRRQLLPAAQVVPVPVAAVSGTIDGAPFTGTGAVAHIYGHGNAQRWVWLHADLGDGAVLELVAATARRPGLRALPPMPLVQLRLAGSDRPRDALAAALSGRVHVDEHGFTTTTLLGGRRLRVRVELPPDRCVVLAYTDPDGAGATCTNTERADVRVELDALTRRGWRRERAWTLDGTGHAEIGRRR